MSKRGNPVQGSEALSYHQPIEYYELIIFAKKLTRVLTLVVIGLVIAHVTTHFIAYTTGHGNQFGLLRQFDLNSENNIPTWYSSVALLFCAVLLGIIGFHKRKAKASFFRHWLTLAGAFLYLSTDEAASIHEMTGRLLHGVLKPYDYFHGYLFYSWVIFGGIGVLIVVTAYCRFLADLPAKTRYLFLLAGTLYVGGALGVEVIGGRYHYLYGRENFTYAMLGACEEGLEMLGIVVFISALTSYLGSLRTGLQILISDGPLKN
jgi:hypothetical protein